MATFGPIQRAYREPTWQRFVAGLVATVLGSVAIADAALRVSRDWTPTAFVVGGFAVLLGVLTMIGSWSRPRFRQRHGSIEGRNGALLIDGKVVVTAPLHAEIDQLDGGVHRVELFEQARYPRITIDVEDMTAARALCDAVANPDTALASYRVAGVSTLAGRIAFAFSVVALGAGGIYATMLSAPAWYVLTVIGILTMRLSARATVGSDGISVSFLGICTFVPFTSVVKVERDDGVLMHLTDGSSMRLGETWGNPFMDRMLERIDLARSHAADTEATERLLARGERTAETWRADLDRLAVPTYRHQALERDRLWEVFENPGADVTARQAAAMLLRRGASEDERARIVRIAEGVVSPELRDRLSGPLEDPDDDDESTEERARLAR